MNRNVCIFIRLPCMPPVLFPLMFLGCRAFFQLLVLPLIFTSATNLSALRCGSPAIPSFPLIAIPFSILITPAFKWTLTSHYQRWRFIIKEVSDGHLSGNTPFPWSGSAITSRSPISSNCHVLSTGTRHTYIMYGRKSTSGEFMHSWARERCESR